MPILSSAVFRLRVPSRKAIPWGSSMTIYNGGYINQDIRQKNLEIESG